MYSRALHGVNVKITKELSMYCFFPPKITLPKSTLFSHYTQGRHFGNVIQPTNLNHMRSGVEPGFDQGGPQIMTGLNCQWCTAVSCERSKPFSAWGLGPTLGPQKLLGISLLNMHSLHFGVPFYTIFEIIKY